MNQTIQECFEAFFADQNDLPVESLEQYRFSTENGYRLAAMNRKYNYFKAGALSNKPLEIENAGKDIKNTFIGDSISITSGLGRYTPERYRELFGEYPTFDQLEMPVAGREVEVLACASFAKSGNIQCWSLQRDHASLRKLEGEGNRIVEMVDRRHVATLTAQLATSEKWAREHCNRAEEFAGQIIESADAIHRLESDLTKAREFPQADAIHQMAFEESQPAENGDGYLFTSEEFDLFVERLTARQSAPAATCTTCHGTRVVDDGEMHCSAGGIPFEMGSIKCVKDCPDCAPVVKGDQS